jgi:hypothetical protein
MTFATRFIKSIPLTLLGTVLAASVQAHTHTTPDKSVTVLTFPLLHLPLPLPFFPESDLTYQGTVGGNVQVSAQGGELAFSVLGELGVSSRSGPLGVGALDLALGKNEEITLTFDKAVSLIGWDLDDVNPLIIRPDGSNKFSLAVDGGAASVLNLRSHLPSSALVGKTFTFAYAGDGYFIDTLTFGSASPVPEAATLAQLGLGLGMMALLMRRKRPSAS